jgi:hypothetical protein
VAFGFFEARQLLETLGTGRYVMNDTTETAPGNDIRARNKAILFDVLAAAGIHRVTVNYDGSGDSGQIEEVEAWDTGNERIPLPFDRKVELILENPDSPCAGQNLEAAIETLAWDYLEIHYGWENNDGAFGSFVFDVPARTITLEHNERYTDVNITNHEF